MRDEAFYSTLVTLICRLEKAAARATDVIEWGCPVPSFGDLSTARVATVGLNPSNREFVDEAGCELSGQLRRFDTLKSLGLSSWLDADARDLRSILAACREYFLRNPYDAWFKRLDQVASGMGVSFYGPTFDACHLDLIPFATRRKWTELSSQQRTSLLSIAADALALLLRDSPVEVIVLNGRAVVEHFQMLADIQLDKVEVEAWALPRSTGKDVSGFGFCGKVRSLSGVDLDRELLILGYNHNLQSSFGVTREVMAAIRNWLSIFVRMKRK